MKIGNKELPEICPDCKTNLIKRPDTRLIRYGSTKIFSTFSMWCPNPKCGWETEKFKIREDYLRRKKPEYEDITPYRNWFQKLFKYI